MYLVPVGMLQNSPIIKLIICNMYFIHMMPIYYSRDKFWNSALASFDAKKTSNPF